MAGLLLAAIALSACQKAESVSTKDPLPLPSGMAENKDLSVKPGDSFYDYCNGSWIKKTPIPASGAKGGLYEQVPEMEQRVEQLKAENNHIIRMWQQVGLTVETAGDSQALIQLKREYCDKKDCLRCRFGYEYLKRK